MPVDGARLIQPVSRVTRNIIRAGSALVGVLVLIAAIVLLSVDADDYKGRFELSASAALGMEVRMGGRVKIGLLPALLVTLEDVQIRNQGMEVASAKEVQFGIGFLPLFKKELRIETMALKQPTVTIERDRHGRFNVETQESAEGGGLPVLDWPKVTFSNATVAYVDKREGGEGFVASDCRLQAQRLRFAGGQRSKLMQGLAFTAEIACGELRGERLAVSDLKVSADAKNGIFELKLLSTRVFGTQGSGSLRADYSGDVPAYQVHYSLSQFPIEEFFKTTSLQQVAAGRMDFSANLSMHGKTRREIRQTLTGRISLRGKQLTLKGSDLDREFARFESSQNFNLVDVGAFFFAGPLGLVVTKGYSFASIVQGAQGSSEIRTLVSDWRVERGVMVAQDVAMATKENRVALRGGLDFVNEQFSDMTMALIDAKGCATVRQAIRGSLRNPVVDKPSLLRSLTGPALRLLKKGTEILSGESCEVFYAGTVAAPK